MNRSTRTLLSKQERTVIGLLLHADPARWFSAAAIERESSGRISRAWARVAAERMSQRGFLDVRSMRARKRKEPTHHYRLRSGTETFVAIAKAYLGSMIREFGSDWGRLALVTFYVAPYVRAELDADLVRTIYASRGTTMRYLVNLDDGSTSLDAAGHEGTSESDSFPGEAWTSLALPVSDPAASRTEKVDSALRSCLPDSPSGPVPTHGRGLRRVVEVHYKFVEDQRLILPTLALLEVSPTALLDFLSDWKVFDSDMTSSESGGIGVVEHVLYRLIFDAVRDVALSRDVSPDWDVTFAAVRPIHLRQAGYPPALLELRWKDEATVGFDASFDTEHLYYQSEFSIEELEDGREIRFDEPSVEEVFRNPENCRVRLWWQSRPTEGEGHRSGA